MSARDPYPFPRLQNDDDFRGIGASQKFPYGENTGNATWTRLHRQGTLSSIRRENAYFDPKAPNDSLDFVLKAQYDQHSEFLKAPNHTLVQAETLNLDHGRILKNKTIEVPPEQNALNHPLRKCEIPKKESLHSVKTAIEGHHLQPTNGGYSRKPCGGFFTS